MTHYRRLIAGFFDSLQETDCLFLGSVTGDLDPFTLLKAKEGINDFFTLCTVFLKVISLIYEKNYFGDRVPLSLFAAFNSFFF